MNRHSFQSHVQTLKSLALSPLGKLRLHQILEEGLPSSLREPFHFLLGAPLNIEDAEVVRKVESLRAELAQNHTLYSLWYAPPSAAQNEFRQANTEWLALTASVPQYWGTFLYLCAKAHRAESILEFGSCAGISGSYLAASKYCSRFVSMEGSPELARLAESNISRVSQNALVVNAFFDAALDEVLPLFDGGIDMAFIDGHHEKEATLRYLDRLIPHLKTGSLLVFDDIQWTGEMWETWQILCRRPGIESAVNLGRFGLCIWDGLNRAPKCFDMSAYCRLWTRGRPA